MTFNLPKDVLMLNVSVVLFESLSAWSVCPLNLLDTLPAVRLVPVI